jgi:molybdenum cofactor biosynthesis enzyme MoaA
VADLFAAGLSSLRVSLNSLREPLYDAYFRPRSYRFADVLQSIERASSASGFVSLNYFVFPGVTDQSAELKVLEALLDQGTVDMIQWRNLNVDPINYLQLMAEAEGRDRSSAESPLGILSLLERLRARYPTLGHGYFNPYVLPKGP